MASTTKAGSTFKDGAWHGQISKDGSFPPEAGRYHLYIGLSPPSPPSLTPLLLATSFKHNPNSPNLRPLLPLRPPRKPNPAPQRPHDDNPPLNRQTLPQRRLDRLPRLEIPLHIRSLRRRNARPPLQQPIPAQHLFPRQARLQGSVQRACAVGYEE